ncbi:MAG: lycopene cyclase domain-containing protein [Halobacteria archaeon]
MNYIGFHLIFTVPVLGVLLAVYLRQRVPAKYSPLGVVAVTAIAFVYTTPWDSYMVRRGVWRYGDGVVTGRVWEVPFGEYLFFVVQPLIAGFWLYVVLNRTETRFAGDAALRWLLGGVGVGVTALGWWWTRGEPTFYIGMILVWAGPPLALQWVYGGHYLVRNARTVVAGLVPPTLYLASVDRFAVENELWIISDGFTTGVDVLGLPVEEGAFFLVTNLLVVQGIVLFRWTLDEWRVWAEEYDIPVLTRLAERGP